MPDTYALLAGSPSPLAQRALLAAFLDQLQPVLDKRGLRGAFTCEPGLRLSRRYGMCQYVGQRLPKIQVRCTRDGDRASWRRPSAIVATLLHEIAHVRYRSHGPRFWQLCRGLLDDAASVGLYDGSSDDPLEHPQGRLRLAGSVADAVLAVARAQRRERARAARKLVAVWPVGGWARVRAGNGSLSNALVRVILKHRTRLVVEAASGRRYLVAVTALEHAS